MASKLEFVDKFNRSIRLTNERWKHIADTHPELKNLLNELSGSILGGNFHSTNIYTKENTCV